ncbi:hypothetical protein KIPB_003988 [Kipferlia bialata]|uniref:Fungal lipase-like domain-containing protein n=1 Tax=Kipferlia bialata TaxID=797122 RepID=A0A9K3CT55_9EUKA|nr:hypothetical protein KIPB_003988 [Kipferlia bialata]|eukprot:g3988.t1
MFDSDLDDIDMVMAGIIVGANLVARTVAGVFLFVCALLTLRETIALLRPSTWSQSPMARLLPIMASISRCKRMSPLSAVLLWSCTWGLIASVILWNVLLPRIPHIGMEEVSPAVAIILGMCLIPALCVLGTAVRRLKDHTKRSPLFKRAGRAPAGCCLSVPGFLVIVSGWTGIPTLVCGIVCIARDARWVTGFVQSVLGLLFMGSCVQWISPDTDKVAAVVGTVCTAIAVPVLMPKVKGDNRTDSLEQALLIAQEEGGKSAAKASIDIDRHGSSTMVSCFAWFCTSLLVVISLMTIVAVFYFGNPSLITTPPPVVEVDAVARMAGGMLPRETPSLTYTPYVDTTINCPVYAGLDLSAYAMMAWGAYSYKPEDAYNWVKPYVPQLIEIKVPDTERLSHFFDMRVMVGEGEDAYELAVLAVAGTEEEFPRCLSDMTQDSALFAPVFMYHALTTMMPMMSLLPPDVPAILSYIAHPLYATPLSGDVEWSYGEDLLSYIDELGDVPVIVTGHSLGASLAQYAAYERGLMAVGFSPVGLTTSRLSLGLDRQVIGRGTYSTIPDGDIVAHIDTVGGATLGLTCEAHTIRSISCHMYAGWFCGLLDKCGPGIDMADAKMDLCREWHPDHEWYPMLGA